MEFDAFDCGLIPQGRISEGRNDMLDVSMRTGTRSTDEAHQLMARRVGGSSLILGIVLAASTVYLAALLFRYVFDIGNVQRHHVESASYIFAAAALAAAFKPRTEHTKPIGLHSGVSPWLSAAFIAAAALLYGNTVFLGMFSDDFVLAQNALAGEWFPQAGLVRPLPLVLWNVLLATTSSPVALHLFNICLHGLNAALVCLLAIRVGVPRAGAMAAGVLFLAFPSSVEAVVWPAAVHDLVVTASAVGFLLLAGRATTLIGLLVGTVVLVLGLLSKESAIAIPFLAMVLWLDLESPRRTRGWPLILAGIAVCVVYGVLRMALVTIPDSYAQEPTRYLVKELIARPVGALTLPWSTAVFSSWPMVPFLWAVSCVAGAATYAWRADRIVSAQTIVRCAIAVFVAVLPVYSILFITPDLENGRYLYLSTAFWVIALVAVASPLTGLTRGRGLVLGAAVVVGVVGVQVHLSSWREAARIREQVLAAAEDTLKTAPCSPVSFVGAPDSVRGAYVFRNGLSEAISFRTGAKPAPSTSHCTFVWNGSEFQRSTDAVGPVQASIAR